MFSETERHILKLHTGGMICTDQPEMNNKGCESYWTTSHLCSDGTVQIQETALESCDLCFVFQDCVWTVTVTPRDPTVRSVSLVSTAALELPWTKPVHHVPAPTPPPLAPVTPVSPCCSQAPVRTLAQLLTLWSGCFILAGWVHTNTQCQCVLRLITVVIWLLMKENHQNHWHWLFLENIFHCQTAL